MKLLIQADDYGITEAGACGIIHGIRHGIIRNTGFFTNMPWAEECAEMIRPYLDQIAFGIDLNASTGPSILPHQELPVLTHENGQFLTSRENRSLDTEENDYDHLNYQEVYAEFDAQIQKFIHLIGKMPDYIHNHAYGTKTTEQVTRDLVKKYHIPYSGFVINNSKVTAPMMGWYSFKGPQEQLGEDLVSFIVQDKGHMLNSEFGYLVTHAGYADAELFRLSSFSLCRVKDLEALCSEEVKQWIKKNSIELITYKDLPPEIKMQE